jgi:hypothetical protein
MDFRLMLLFKGLKGQSDKHITIDDADGLSFNAVMARPVRIEYAGAVYHVMARGNQGQKICADDGDRKMWLATVNEVCRRTFKGR